MYERFTKRAREVMQHANKEAQRLQHEYIGTEHILLGLARLDSGVAVSACGTLVSNLAGSARSSKRLSKAALL